MSFFKRSFALVLLASVSMTAEGALAQAPDQAAPNPPAQTPAPNPPAAPTQTNQAQPAPAQPNATRPGAAKEPAAAAPATETPAVVIAGGAAVALLGMSVKSSKNEDLGRVVDVIVDRLGLTRAAIVDFGGFLGVGTRKIAVDWRAIHFPDKGALDRLIADLPRDQLKLAPVFKEGEPIVVIGGPPPPPPPPEAQKQEQPRRNPEGGPRHDAPQQSGRRASSSRGLDWLVSSSPTSRPDLAPSSPST